MIVCVFRGAGGTRSLAEAARGARGGGRGEPGGEITGTPLSRGRGEEAAGAPALPMPWELVFCSSAGQPGALGEVFGAPGRGGKGGEGGGRGL